MGSLEALAATNEFWYWSRSRHIAEYFSRERVNSALSALPLRAAQAVLMPEANPYLGFKIQHDAACSLLYVCLNLRWLCPAQLREERRRQFRYGNQGRLRIIPSPIDVCSRRVSL